MKKKKLLWITSILLVFLAIWGLLQLDLQQKRTVDGIDLSHHNTVTDWDKVIPIDHGYDESKPEEALTLEDMKGAAKFRSGECLSDEMTQGDWQSKLGLQMCLRPYL